MPFCLQFRKFAISTDKRITGVVVCLFRFHSSFEKLGKFPPFREKPSRLVHSHKAFYLDRRICFLQVWYRRTSSKKITPPSRGLIMPLILFFRAWLLQQRSKKFLWKLWTQSTKHGPTHPACSLAKEKLPAVRNTETRYKETQYGTDSLLIIILFDGTVRFKFSDKTM